MLNVVIGKLLRMMTFIRNEFDVLHTTVPERVVFYAISVEETPFKKQINIQEFSEYGHEDPEGGRQILA